MEKTGEAYCGFGFQVYSKPVGEIRIKMENSQHSFWQKVEALIPETLSWAPPMKASVRPELRKRPGDRMRAGDGVGCALHVQPG